MVCYYRLFFFNISLHFFISKKSRLFNLFWNFVVFPLFRRTKFCLLWCEICFFLYQFVRATELRYFFIAWSLYFHFGSEQSARIKRYIQYSLNNKFGKKNERNFSISCPLYLNVICSSFSSISFYIDMLEMFNHMLLFKLLSSSCWWIKYSNMWHKQLWSLIKGFNDC